MDTLTTTRTTIIPAGNVVKKIELTDSQKKRIEDARIRFRFNQLKNFSVNLNGYQEIVIEEVPCRNKFLNDDSRLNKSPDGFVRLAIYLLPGELPTIVIPRHEAYFYYGTEWKLNSRKEFYKLAWFDIAENTYIKQNSNLYQVWRGLTTTQYNEFTKIARCLNGKISLPFKPIAEFSSLYRDSFGVCENKYRHYEMNLMIDDRIAIWYNEINIENKNNNNVKLFFFKDIIKALDFCQRYLTDESRAFNRLVEVANLP